MLAASFFTAQFFFLLCNEGIQPAAFYRHTRAGSYMCIIVRRDTIIVFAQRLVRTSGKKTMPICPSYLLMVIICNYLMCGLRKMGEMWKTDELCV